MKRLILSLIAVALVGIFSAGAEEFVLGGCNHKIASGSGYGSDDAGHIAAAMYIPGSKLRSLAGNDISVINVGLVSRINVRDLHIWVRKTLDGANLAVETVERPTTGWNEVRFAAPYVIEKDLDGLYIGYDYENAGSSHPVSFTGDGSEYVSYLKINSSAWENMSQRGALSIEAVVTGSNLPQYDLAFVSGQIYPNLSGAANSYIVAGELSNLALKDVKGFTLTVAVSGSSVAETHVDALVPQGGKGAFTATVETGSPLADEVTLTISAVDGGQDANMTNNSVNARVGFPKNVLVEEFTTENCVNCPNAAEWFSNVLASDPLYRTRVVPVCHHSAFGTDWLTRDCDTELLWLFNMGGQSFAPAAMFDRHAAFKKGLNMDKYEPIVALRSQKDFEDCIRAELQESTHAMLGLQITDVRETEQGTEMDVAVRVLTDDAFSMTDPILVFYALEDHVDAVKQSGASGKFYHHHVIRYDNGSYGEELQLDGNRFEKTYTVAFKPGWKMENVYFAAFITNHDTEDVNNNKVENAAALYIADTPAGVAGVTAEEAREIGRYDINGLLHTEAFKGLNIIVYSDGSVKKEFVK